MSLMVLRMLNGGFWCYYSYKYYCTINKRRTTMWTKPAATEMRFGFEVTLYVMNR
jgi:coenzyme PQQ precursor peptide PqqA